MNGRNHIAAGTAFLGCTAAFAVLSSFDTAPASVSAAGRAAVRVFQWATYQGSHIVFRIGCAAACAVFYYAGLLAPDLDHPGSTASKALHVTIPGPHRGITHTVWAVTACCIAGVALWRPFLALALGMLAHDLADWPSQAGWSAFYPFGSWRVVHDTVMSKRHWFVLYSSSAPGSETVVAGFMMLMAVLAASFAAYLTLWPV